MIRDVAELDDGMVLRAEVGVVGAGFAGIDLTRYLARHGVHVVLLESGRLEFDPAIQALARTSSVGMQIRIPDPDGGFTPYLEPIYRGETRLRQFGGTSNIWTGKWRTFDALDFEERSWIPYSGWPIGIEDLRPFYAEVAREYGLADFDGFARNASNHRLRKVAAPAGLKQSFHYWQKEPLRLSGMFRQESERSANIDIVLGASATEIVLDPDLEHVRAVGFRSLDGRRFTLSAGYVVLAVGGQEAPRLLLASNRQIPAGIGNGRDLVGRFYMDHPKHKRGKLWPSRAMKMFAHHCATEPRPRFHTSFSLSDEVQRAQSLLNHAIYFTPVYRYQREYPTESVEAIKAALRSARVERLLPPARALAASPGAVWKVVERVVYRDRGGPVAHYASSMYVEQAPNPESRVYLGSERDALGMPKLVVDWRPTPLDYEGFQRLLRGLTAALAQAGLGRLEFGPEPLTLDDTVDAAHHIGATRMAAAPVTGVVDRDCRVFGTDNLFIASSSVFPTGHSAAPTFTIMALARRLGAHIIGLCSRAPGAQHRRHLGSGGPPPDRS